MKNSTLVGGEIFEFSPVEDLTTDIEHMTHDEVQQVVLVAKKLRDMADMQLLIATSAMHKMDSARVTDGLTTLGWLRRFCRMSASKASNTLKTAKALSHMDTVTKHAVAGEITTDSVRQLAMARDRHPDDFVVHEDVFADIATYLTPAELRRAINHWEQHHETSGPTRRVPLAHARRHVGPQRHPRPRIRTHHQHRDHIDHRPDTHRPG